MTATVHSPHYLLRMAVAARPEGERADWLRHHLETKPDADRRYAWHVAEALFETHPEPLRAAATALLAHAPSRPFAAMALARLHNRLGEFDALRALILSELPAPPVPRPEWLRALLRTELLAPSAEAGRHWAMAMAELSPLTRRSLRLQHHCLQGRPADAGPVREVLAKRLPGIMAQGMPPALERLAMARDVAVVGNGSGLRGSGAGAAIEAHDMVIRMNYPLLTGHEADAGRRCDLMLFHETKRPILPSLVTREPGFDTLPALGIRGIAFEDPAPPGPPRLPNGLIDLVSGIAYPWPTTGLTAIILAAVVFARPVTLFGFDFFAPGRQGHYFGDVTAAVMHELAYERWFAAHALPVLGHAVTRHSSSA